ncbi:MAG TPA: HAD-IIIA family hydrolase [Drouetiella sp.]|jgi:D-glycero-D-manno-heptose 1,7-bisphosphate phosphatase
MLKTVFLDRDGIINEIVMREGIVSSPRTVEEFTIRPDFIEFYNRLNSSSLRLFVVSNQPDVSRGAIDKTELAKIVDVMNARFKFTEILHCIHDDSDQCNCRKPKPGMISGFLQNYGLSADEAIIIGDSYKDILAGKAAGIQTVYLQQAYNALGACEPDYVVTRLTEIFSLPPFLELS